MIKRKGLKMKDNMLQLVQLLKQNRSLNQICEITGINPKQLFLKLSMLKNSGYLFERTYHMNGEIKYHLSSPLLKKEEDFIINTSPSLSSIRMLVTSDAHYGSIYDGMENTHLIREHATKEGIHLIFNLGDFFDGICAERRKSQKYSNIEETIQRVLHDFPYDKNILNFLILGNHDFSIWKNSGIDISYVLKERRHDIVPLGYGAGMVAIHDFQFYLKHPIPGQKLENAIINNSVLYKGHSHEFKLNNSGGNFIVTVPSSSRERLSLGIIPSFLEIEYSITKEENKIYQAICKQYLLLNHTTYKASETIHSVNILSKSKKLKMQ